MPKLTDEKKKLIENLIHDRVYEEATNLLKLERVDAFTMAELAESVGVAKGTLYNYFKDKQEVIFYVYKRLDEEFMGKIKKHFAEHPHDFENNLRFFIRTNLETRRANHFMDTALVSYTYEIMKNKSKNKLGAPIFKPFMVENRKFMTDFFLAGQEAGVFKDYPPKFMAGFIDIYLLGVKTYAFMSVSELFDNEIAKSAFSQTEEMLLNTVCKKQQ